MIQFTTNKASCPECDSEYIRRTRRQGVGDTLFAVVRIFPYRCLTCDTRYYSVGRYFGQYAEEES
ncbi:hypothetical protein Pse7367_2354 [Thalassoporum mexicanum PCC 7367]|uniref:hypothetical protein n=1 Tax=Thalassoporum mexicanum TaxID=3457544 RepID=UPI00029FF518|nr:hypothetical protein [Pseudanabaena sp. PCC 7367]AFY70615.1 hypothetical protein Pse7367_2354 [Pseudanabaena sp. PCC 7367]